MDLTHRGCRITIDEHANLVRNIVFQHPAKERSMKCIFCAAIILTLGGITGSAQQPSQSAGDRRDLSGIWSTFPGVNPVSGLKREVGGVAETTVVDRTAIRGVVGQG